MKYDKYIGYAKEYWSRPLFASLTIFILFFGLLVTIFVISEGDPVPDDQYFHFKYAYLLRTEGWDVVEHFKWIQSSPHPTGGSRYAVNLFQGSLIPFTYFNDWLLGLRVAEAFYASMVVALLYYIMRKERVRYPLFFALLLVSSTFFMSRILLGRAFVLMLGLIFLEMYMAIHRKYIPLFVVVVLHVLWHQNTYFMPLIMVGIVEFSRYFVEKKIELKNIFVTVCGIIVGMMFFPGFPGSLIGWMRNLFGIKENSAGTTAGSLGGNELRAIDFSAYFLGEMAMFLLLAVSVFLIIFLYFKQKEDNQKRKRKRQFDAINKEHLHWVYSLSIFLSVVIFGSITMSGRFFDFMFPTVVLLLAFIVTILLDSKFISFKKSTVEWMNMFVWIFVGVLFMGSMMIVYKKANTFDYQPAKLAAQWIDANSATGEKVYLNNWSNFNMMFFANSNNVYSMGIEPYSLKVYDESLYWKYYNLFRHKYYCELQGDCTEEIADTFAHLTDDEQIAELVKENSEKVINSIKNDFGSSFIVSDSELLNEIVLLHPELIESQFEIKSDKFDKKGHMEFMVFKLK